MILMLRSKKSIAHRTMECSPYRFHTLEQKYPCYMAPPSVNSHRLKEEDLFWVTYYTPSLVSCSYVLF